MIQLPPASNPRRPGTDLLFMIVAPRGKSLLLAPFFGNTGPTVE
jgi:hypothetical protein